MSFLSGIDRTSMVEWSKWHRVSEQLFASFSYSLVWWSRGLTKTGIWVTLARGKSTKYEIIHESGLIVVTFGRIGHMPFLVHIYRLFTCSMYIQFPRQTRYIQSPLSRRWGGSRDRAATSLEPTTRARLREAASAGATNHPATRPPGKAGFASL